MLIIGHRGAPNLEPENTVASFKKAIELGADMVECDVYLSKDGHLIVMHDDTFDRTTNGKGKIGDKTLEEIRQLRTKDKNQPVPTLEEVLDLVKGKIPINVEIKGVAPAEKVVELIHRKKMEKEVIVSSFMMESVIKVKQKTPNIRTALLIGGRKFILITENRILKKAKGAGADFVNPKYSLCSKRFIEKLHKAGYKVNVWVVNSAHEMKKLAQWDADSVFTNDIELAKRVLKDGQN